MSESSGSSLKKGTGVVAKTSDLDSFPEEEVEGGINAQDRFASSEDNADDVSTGSDAHSYGSSKQQHIPIGKRVFGALFYGASSILIMVVNKYVLSVWQFPSSSVLALAQFVCTVLSLDALKYFGYIDFPKMTWENAKKVFPLPLLFLLNTVTGLAGTQAINIPMFTVLRRLNMLFTMVLEGLLLGYAYTTQVKVSIAVILSGSLLAAINDLAFDAYGYLLVFLNNVFTSASGVVSKMKLDASRGSASGKVLSGLGRWGLMYYNALFSGPLLALFLIIVQPNHIRDTLDFEHWNSPIFIFMFILSSVMGTILQLSIFYCTEVNSSLTTVVVGCLKNVLTTYIGMVSPGLDYVYSFPNFVGVNISMAGGIWYAYMQFTEQTMKPASSSSSSSSTTTTTSSSTTSSNNVNINIKNKSKSKSNSTGNGNGTTNGDYEYTPVPTSLPVRPNSPNSSHGSSHSSCGSRASASGSNSGLGSASTSASGTGHGSGPMTASKSISKASTPTGGYVAGATTKAAKPY